MVWYTSPLPAIAMNWASPLVRPAAAMDSAPPGSCAGSSQACHDPPKEVLIVCHSRPVEVIARIWRVWVVGPVPAAVTAMVAVLAGACTSLDQLFTQEVLWYLRL